MKIYRFLIHMLSATNSFGHGVHSPFLFSFTQNVVYEKNQFYIFSHIEKLREALKKNNQIVKITDYGAGNKEQAHISDIARKSLKRKRWAQLLHRAINFVNAKNVLELGTSLGITTAYMATVHTGIKCISLEGASEIAKMARKNLDTLKITNTKIIEGNIDETLEQALCEFETLDFVFFDANHRKEPTLKYFEKCLCKTNENSIFVFDDIHWSSEMHQAWNVVKNNKKVTSTIDLFEIGIVFFRKNLPKANFKMIR